MTEYELALKAKKRLVSPGLKIILWIDGFARKYLPRKKSCTLWYKCINTISSVKKAFLWLVSYVAHVA